MGPCLGDNTVWSGSATDGCACGGYKQRKCQNNRQTSKGRGSKTLRKWDREGSRNYGNERELKIDGNRHYKGEDSTKYRRHVEDMQNCPLVLDGAIIWWWWMESMLSSMLNTRLWEGRVAFHPHGLGTNRLDESQEMIEFNHPLKLQQKKHYITQKAWPPRLLKVGTDSENKMC